MTIENVVQEGAALKGHYTPRIIISSYQDKYEMLSVSIMNQEAY